MLWLLSEVDHTFHCNVYGTQVHPTLLVIFLPSQSDLAALKGEFTYRMFGCGCAARFRTLDPSKPWVLFWATHGLNLLGRSDEVAAMASGLIAVLSTCQHPDGGFAGGPGQQPHLAPTYAAGNAACFHSQNKGTRFISYEQFNFITHAIFKCIPG
jgi:hypothetical protein